MREITDEKQTQTSDLDEVVHVKHVFQCVK